MAREERRPPHQSPDATRFQDRLRFLHVAVGMTAGDLEQARKKLAHLNETDKAGTEDMYTLGKTSGELGADTDLIVAMRELNFSHDLMLRIWDGVNNARTNRKKPG